MHIVWLILMILVTTDNTSLELEEENQQDKANLKLIANKSIKQLIKDNSNLLIFPQHLKVNDDDIEDECIFELKENILSTNNIMGFFGINDTQLKIQSRFAKATEENDEDYFLHYMLQRVFCINLFDLKHGQKQASLFDLLVYLLPYFLKKALSQGLYKEYHKKTYNNADIKGAISINTHIKHNVPFMGNVAYKVREHSFENRITQLIRHTIEFIKQKKVMRDILHVDSDTQKSVNLIIQYTPSYHARDRYSVINDNLKPFTHPYFFEYAGLQNICIQILMYEGLKYTNNSNKAHGLLFDGAWLWEEYLNTFLKEIGFLHPQNKKSKGGIKVFSEKITGNNTSSRFPDFVKDNIILDAKYKRMSGNSIERNDMNQIISYLYLYKAGIGGFIAPTSSENNNYANMGVLNGYGGSIHKFKLAIPQNASSFQSFIEAIRVNEYALVESVQDLCSLNGLCNERSH